MNEIISLLQNHRSIRKFTKEAVSSEQLSAILTAAQAASTSSNIQAYSVIGITDVEVRKQLAALAGNQGYVNECPLFLVWCADLHRFEQAVQLHGNTPVTGNAENFIIATVDAALAAQNAAIAAESLGLGVVYIGGLRNNPSEVSQLLELPQLVYPVFGMCIGTPDQEPLLRPRLPQEAVYHENRYTDKPSAINVYDETIRTYMKERTGGKVDTTWSKEMAGKAMRPREHMKSFLRTQGYEIE
ncbi:oxygen-insensitive NADPH nitroreductase [Paenibacillus sp. SYP-B3998]|uniref:Oxygen-insensitive NADPH nitroreductase n=1 Tax=Paenibacillus sp. SYP-B3998 TaxID=2678564 RepID=A0A6G4A081_9BACL|nr:oxygen-insensitive NADPH nitroreductase [Paenibacillus sp. SYP-B3998]NEW07775.1 oxygen-insensitive NADPH nitroreductase [Paenibacillus sp. SYP-B3998]